MKGKTQDGRIIPLFDTEFSIGTAGNLNISDILDRIGTAPFVDIEGGRVSQSGILEMFISTRRNQSLITNHIGEYASTKWEEFIAETFAAGLMNSNPGKISQALLDVIDEVLEDLG